MLKIESTITPERSLQRIALEANVLSNMASTLKNLFPSLVDKFRSSFSLTEGLDSIQIKLTKEQEFLVKHINDVKFIDIAELGTQVPEGFHGTYIDYAKELIHAVDRLTNITTKVLQPYATYLGTFLTNKDAKIDTRMQTKVYDELKKSRESLIKDLSKFTKNNDYTAKAKIGKVISRNADFKTVYEEVAVLKKKIDGVNIKTMNEVIKRSLDLLDIIISRIEKGDIPNISPEVSQNLSYGAYEIASEIEFFSVVYYKVIALGVSVDATTVKVNNYIQNIPD